MVQGLLIQPIAVNDRLRCSGLKLTRKGRQRKYVMTTKKEYNDLVDVSLVFVRSISLARSTLLTVRATQKNTSKKSIADQLVLDTIQDLRRLRTIKYIQAAQLK